MLEKVNMFLILRQIWLWRIAAINTFKRIIRRRGRKLVDPADASEIDFLVA